MDEAARFPLWNRHDTFVLLRLPVAVAIAWLTDEPAWDRVAARIARRRSAVRPDYAGLAEAVRSMMGARLDEHTIRGVVAEAIANYRLRQLQILRCWRPGGWHPRTRIVGRHHLEQARADGRGAILWVVPFVFASLVSKASLAQDGFALHHLSRWFHGNSRSRLGVALLNRIQQRAEEKFLAGRVVIEPDQSPVAATRRLAALLRANQIVSITVGPEGAARLGSDLLEGRIEVANGAVKLARQSGAPLLPTFTLREPDGSFTTTIEAPVPPAALAGVGTDAVAVLAAGIERHVLRAPGQLMWLDPILQRPQRSAAARAVA